MSRKNTAAKKNDNVNYQVTTGEETWLTPKYVMDALQAANDGERFDVDPCTPPTQPWPTAKRRFTLKTDGLLQPGEAKPWNPKDFYFMNPPYGRVIGSWFERLAVQNNGIALCFARTDTAWWHAHVGRKAKGLYFVRSRMAFCDAQGVPGKNKATASSVLIAYGERALRVLAQIEKKQSIKGYLVRC